MKIAVCIVALNNYYQTRYCIENLFDKAKMPLSLYLFTNSATDLRLLDYCINLCRDTGHTHIHKSHILTRAGGKNTMLKEVKEEYICIFPADYLVSNDWEQELYYNAVNIDNAGVLSIRNGKENLVLTSFLHRSESGEDYMDNAWLPADKGYINGLMFFNKKVVDEIGYFDEDMSMYGFDEDDFIVRANAVGFNNFYIRKQTAIKVCKQEAVKKTQETYKIFKDNVNTMFKTNNYKKCQ